MIAMIMVINNYHQNENYGDIDEDAYGDHNGDDMTMQQTERALTNNLILDVNSMQKLLTFAESSIYLLLLLLGFLVNMPCCSVNQ